MDGDGHLKAVEPVRSENEVEAFLELVERHSRGLYGLAYRITGSAADAQDVLQESLFRAYQQLAQFEKRAELGTWLRRIVVNCGIDYLRAAKSRPDHRQPQPIADLADVIASPSAGPERLAESAETARHIAAALETLRPLERAAFTLRHFEGRSIDEIAQALGVRNNAAKQHVFRAIRKLRRALEQQGSGQ